jgi:hypothetical protein
MDKDVEGEMIKPPDVLWPVRSRGLLPIPQMAGAMLLPDVLQRKSLFSLLYKIDLDLAQQAKTQGCPTVGGPLHDAHYLRKPRGGPPDLCEALEVRFSLCCGRAGCRRDVGTHIPSNPPPLPPASTAPCQSSKASSKRMIRTSCNSSVRRIRHLHGA